MAHLERRTAPRAEYTGITMVRSAGEDIPSVAGNISECGILLFPKVKPRTFDPALELTFTLPNQTCWYTVEGRLVHQSRVRSQLAWGVRFLDPPRLIRNAVREFVEQQLRAARRDAPALPPVVRPPVPEPVPRPDSVTIPASEVPTAELDAGLLEAVRAEARSASPTTEPDLVIDVRVDEDTVNHLTRRPEPAAPPDDQNRIGSR